MRNLGGFCKNVCGATSLGERGQVVIPKELRDEMKLKTGDKLFVIEHNGAIVLVSKKMMQKFVSAITRKLNL